jgi:WD40 repeat protein
VTSASDGYLYLWNDKKIIKKQNAHPKAPILCLYASKNSKIFASGAADGKVIIWLLSSSSIIQKIF